jgi:hypothetical protein
MKVPDQNCRLSYDTKEPILDCIYILSTLTLNDWSLFQNG